MFNAIRGACACAGAATALACAGAPVANAAGDPVCHPSTSVPAVAAAAHVGRAEVAIARSVGRNGQPQCTFAPRGHRPPSVTVNVDSAPQAAWRLMRTVVEASQIFGVPPPGWAPPIGLNGLGPYASWFPELDALMATNRIDLISVDVNWPRSSRSAKIALARRIVVPYLHRSG